MEFPRIPIDQRVVAMGIDPGTRSCGVAFVTQGDALEHVEVIKCADDTQPHRRIATIKTRLSVLCQRYNPSVIGVERFVPHKKDRDYYEKLKLSDSARNTQQEYMCWMVGSCLDLGACATPGCDVVLYRAVEWRQQLIGSRHAVSKADAVFVLKQRYRGKRFTSPGLHDADAVGIATVSLDTYLVKARFAER